jgi:hypothetical protein
MYTLVTFAPPGATEEILEALFAAGAGRLGNYEGCAFVARGEGRFRPLEGAAPAIGEVNRDERVVEDRMELVVPEERVDAVLATLRLAHPYEEPAIYLYALDPRCLSE